jgi:cadmium resistance protein CadD (predicted permease)
VGRSRNTASLDSFSGTIAAGDRSRQLFGKRRTELELPRISNSGIASVALVTLSNGADNIGVYVPFFVDGRPYLWLILIVYAVMVVMWCSVGRWLGNHSLILRSVDRWGHWAVPLVFIGLGIYVLNS